MTRIYESMFLIDNDAVRAGWKEAKASLAALVEKHGGHVLSSRRWDERRLAYPIRHRNRATFLLTFCELAPETMADLRRDLDISETVLRYLILSRESVPQKELELSAAEQATGFEIPEPPSDDASAPTNVELADVSGAEASAPPEPVDAGQSENGEG